MVVTCARCWRGRAGQDSGVTSLVDADQGRVTGRRISLVLATSTGGVGRHVQSLARELIARGALVTVHGPPATDESFAFSSLGAGFSPVEIARARSPLRDTRAVVRLRSALAPAELVHAHGLRAGAVAGLALSKRRRTPYVVTWHNAILGSAAHRRVYSTLEAWVARRADVTLGASGDLVRRAASLGARRAVLGPVAAPALPPPSADPAVLRASLGATDRPLVVAVGRLSEQKRFDVLVDAARLLRDDERPPLVVIAGSGPLADRIASQIRTVGAPVRLLGHRADVADLLAIADVVALPSEWEARALVAQEAMRAGRPLVATAVGGLPDLVGDAALLIPPGDASALAKAIRSLLAHPLRAAEIGAAGRRRARSWPDEHAAVDIITGVYAELLTEVQ
jgi:glycosyltransferase involved in cell wall biosynthesis